MENKRRDIPFTINNFSPDDWVNCLAEEVLFGAYAQEIGELGTPHIQGYFYFKNPRSLNSLKKRYPKIHFSLPVKGTPEQNLTYIQGPYTNAEGKHKPFNPDAVVVGECPAQGSRNDLAEIRRVVKETGKMRDVVNISQSYQGVKMAEQILKYHEPRRKWTEDFKVYWYYGETGTGKTKAAYKAAQDISGSDYYSCLNTGKWWDGYDAHEIVIIDDFRSNFCCFAELLKILQPVEYRVETKGGTRQLLATKFYITSPYSPQECYSTIEDKKQLLRRITEVKKF